ncbi:hypothetical protein BN871_JI_00040 [Paenibacillus sp. P22]|nr:hypothetical protein BN871_JI_00040 [Paenibacillus sp. P22]
MMRQAIRSAAPSSTSRSRPVPLVDGDDSFLDLGERADDRHRLASGREHFPARQIERRILLVVAGHFQQPLLADAVDDRTEIAPIDRSRAHGAGLDRRVHDAVPQELPVIDGGGPLHQRRFRMSGAIALRNLDVALLQQHAAFLVDENRSERRVALRPRPLRYLHCKLQIRQMVFWLHSFSSPDFSMILGLVPMACFSDPCTAPRTKAPCPSGFGLFGGRHLALSFRGSAYGPEYASVPGAAANIAGQRLLRLQTARARIMLQQRRDGDDHSRRAVAALKASFLKKSRLDPAGPLSLQPLDRHQIRAAALVSRQQAAVDRLSVQQHHAGSAASDFTGALGPRQAQILPEQREHAAGGPCSDRPLFAVEAERQLERGLPAAFLLHRLRHGRLLRPALFRYPFILDRSRCRMPFDLQLRLALGIFRAVVIRHPLPLLPSPPASLPGKNAGAAPAVPEASLPGCRSLAGSQPRWRETARPSRSPRLRGDRRHRPPAAPRWPPPSTARCPPPSARDTYRGCGSDTVPLP